VNEEEMREKIQNDPLFVNVKRFEYDIEKLEVKFPDGCPNHVIADALMMTEDEVEAHMDAIVSKLRTVMGVEP
jgi:hypothetical protein